jgi:hypothetical protein
LELSFYSLPHCEVAVQFSGKSRAARRGRQRIAALLRSLN